MRTIGRNTRANHKPFTGRGASLYAGVGPVDGSDPGPRSVVFRKLRTIGIRSVRGSTWTPADGIVKTSRIAHVSDPTQSFSYPVPDEWKGRIVYLQVRTHWEDCELLTNVDPLRLDFTSSGTIDSVIHGTGTIIAADKLDGGLYKIRTRYFPALDGTQPTTLLIRKASGPGTLADVSLDYNADQQNYTFTTAALTDAATYTLSFYAKSGSVELLLDQITFTADASGPPAPTGLSLTAT